MNNETAKLRVRIESDSVELLKSVRDELHELWPFAYPSEVMRVRDGKNIGDYRCYLTTSMAVPETEEY